MKEIDEIATRNAIIFLLKNSHTISHNKLEENVVSMQQSANLRENHRAPEVKQVKPINFITFDRMTEFGFVAFSFHFKKNSNGLHSAYGITLHTMNTCAPLIIIE